MFSKLPRRSVSWFVTGLACAALSLSPLPIPGLGRSVVAGTVREAPATWKAAPDLRSPALQAAPALAVLAGGKLMLFKNGASTKVAPIAVAGTLKPMAVMEFQWSASGRYLGWQQGSQTSAKSAAGWYDTLTHRRASWTFQYQYPQGWSVSSAGLASLVPGGNLGAPSTLTRYNIDGAVTHQSVRVPISDNVTGYSSGFVMGPDIVSGTRLWRVSLSGAVTKLQALPKPATNGPPYEITAVSPDGKLFAAELGDHTDGCGIGPASRIFVVDEATGTTRQASLPGGPRWRVLSFVFGPDGTLDATLVDCTQKASMSTTVVWVSPSGKVTAVKHGALVATAGDGYLAYEAGEVHLGGTEAPELDEVASGPLTVNGRPVPGAAVAATASWAP